MHTTHEKHLELPDQNQSAWQLAAIQLSGWMSLPILATSILILQENSFLGACLTIIIGNALLWFIRLGIIAMSHEDRQSTLDVAKNYLGATGRYFISVLLLVSTLAWFIAQTNTASSVIMHLLAIKESPDIDQFTQISVFLGIVSTLFCMGGMVLLRRLSTFALPILIFLFLVILYALTDRTYHANGNQISLAGLTLVLATNLGITSDLPTFFRHSRSWNSSVIALTIIQLVSLILGLASLYLGSILQGEFEINQMAVLSSGGTLLRNALVAFVFLSVICANVANVYSASVGWELIAPKALVGRQELFILGLGLTTVFILVSGLFSVDYLLNASDNSLVNLCLVLVIGYIISKRKKASPDSFDQIVYFTAWLTSSLVNGFQMSGLLLSEISPFATSLIIITIITTTSLTLKK